MSGNIAVKLYDANDQIAVWYGSAGPATIDLTQLDSTLVATKVAIMANSADVTCSVVPTTIVFSNSEGGTSLTYNTALTIGGYGYTIADGVVTFDGQYQEIKYTLPSTVTVGDYTSLSLDLGTVTGAIAVKLYDADGQIAVWYGSAGPATIDLTQLDSTLVATTVAIMANSADVTCSAMPATIVFTAE